MHIIEQSQVTDPVGTLYSLKEKVYDHERFTIEEYLGHLAQSLWKFHALGLDIEGKTLEEKCESCLKQLIEHGLVVVN